MRRSEVSALRWADGADGDGDGVRSPPVPASPHDWLAERRFALNEGARTGDRVAVYSS